MPQETTLTGVERFFEDDELIVTKTDLKGRITYCNDVFIRLAGFSEKESLGQPHSIIRHPDMPRCVFGLLWDTIQAGQEIFAYVVNRSKNGDHYWVNAHVTPSYDSSGKIIGYHSNRRVPDRNIVDNAIIPLYRDLLAEEQRHANRKEGQQAATQMVVDLLQKNNMQYDEFVAGL